MAYEIDLQRPTSRSIARAYRKTLKKAHGVLTAPAPDDDPVHDARTSVKRSRALLRLTRHDLGRAIFKRENDALREAGRALSAVRDAVVLVDAMDGLLERADEEARSRLAPLRAALAARRDEHLARSGELMAEAARALDEARDRASRVTPAHRGWKALGPGLDRAYRSGLERLSRACATERDEDFHALRKAVKDLTYQARFLRPLDEPTMRAEEALMKHLGDLLGDDHDLTVLGAVARDLEGAEPAAVEQLAALVAARKAELRSEARTLAESLFAEPRKQRRARLEEAFRAARTAARSGGAAPPRPALVRSTG